MKSPIQQASLHASITNQHLHVSGYAKGHFQHLTKVFCPAADRKTVGHEGSWGFHRFPFILAIILAMMGPTFGLAWCLAKLAGLLITS